MINQIDMIDPSIKCGAERLYRQALEIRVENPQLPIGHTKFRREVQSSLERRRPANLQCLAVVPLSAAIVTDELQVPSKLPMANRALRIACGLNLPATADVSSAMGLTRRLAAEVVLAGLVYRRRERGKRRQSP